MSVQLLQKYLPENTLPHLKNWFGEEYIHIKITKGRHSKLGDYRKMPDRSHLITVNSTLQPSLFFFVLTHELAHLIAFEKYGRLIAPHGKEWKHTFRTMLMESIGIYPADLQQIILHFSKNPKANFMASPELVKYFNFRQKQAHMNYVEELSVGERFLYRQNHYQVEQKLKKNYLCKNLESGKKYVFKGLAQVEKLD